MYAYAWFGVTNVGGLSASLSNFSYTRTSRFYDMKSPILINTNTNTNVMKVVDLAGNGERLATGAPLERGPKILQPKFGKTMASDDFYRTCMVSELNPPAINREPLFVLMR